MGLFGHFFSRLSFFFLPLWETARYRLKYCLKEPLNPKQPTNQHYNITKLYYWLVGSFRFNDPSETVFQSVSDSLPERGRKKLQMTDKMSKQSSSASGAEKDFRKAEKINYGHFQWHKRKSNKKQREGRE